MKNKKNIIYSITILLIMLCAFYLRLKGYLFCRPTWYDECSLFGNVYKLKYIELFQGLWYGQSAPPIFLVVEKFIISIFGIKEIAMRFLPFLVSIIAIPVFYKFSKIFLIKKWSIIVANILFAINLQLIFYAQEFKQYSTDVLVTMVLFMLLYRITIKNITPKKEIFYCIITSVSPLISLPTYFITAGWFLRELFNCHSVKTFLKLLKIQIPLFVMTVLYYFIALKPQREIILQYASSIWNPGFITTNLKNNIDIIINNIIFIFDPCIDYIAIIILFILGILLIIKKCKKKYNAHLLLTLYSVIICAMLRLYPLKERIILYLIPIIIIILVKSLDLISTKRKIYSILLMVIFIFAFNNYNFDYLKQCNNVTYWRYRCANPRLLMQILIDKYQPQDTIFISAPSAMEYEYYKKYYNFYPQKEIFVPVDTYNQEFLINNTKELHTCWFYYSGDWDFIFQTSKKVLKAWRSKNNYKILLEYEDGLSYLLHIEK